MKKIKKICLFVLLAATCIFTLASCGKKTMAIRCENSTGQKELIKGQLYVNSYYSFEIQESSSYEYTFFGNNGYCYKGRYDSVKKTFNFSRSGQWELKDKQIIIINETAYLKTEKYIIQILNGNFACKYIKVDDFIDGKD